MMRLSSHKLEKGKRHMGCGKTQEGVLVTIPVLRGLPTLSLKEFPILPKGTTVQYNTLRVKL